MTYAALKHRAGREPDDVEVLIHSHLQLVRRLAWHVHGRVSAGAELEELIQAGMVALVEAARPGGDCTHFGCVPSKALLETARRVQAARNGKAYGFSATVDVDFPRVMDRVHAVIADIERDESPELLAAEGIDLIADWGVVTGPTSLDVGGRRVSFDKLVLASGSRAFVPPVDGLDAVPYLDNKNVFALRELPAHLIVLGGGPIGCELAQAFALTAQEPQLDLLTLKGSYAGAMGMGQFMPSSYRLWAKDGDRDGRRDLLTHKPDVFASIANYFVIHGWQPDGPVVARASFDARQSEFVPENLEPVHPLSAMAARGYRPMTGEPVPADLSADGATVVNLDGDAGREHWLGYRNYYVITRYNRSPMYALAVHQLAQQIRAGAQR